MYFVFDLEYEPEYFEKELYYLWQNYCVLFVSLWRENHSENVWNSITLQFKN